MIDDLERQEQEEQDKTEEKKRPQIRFLYIPMKEVIKHGNRNTRRS